MTVVVYILGAMLVLAGAVIIGTGVPIVRLEIGWSEVIGGAVAGSAGFVIVALGVVLSRLEAMHRSILAMQLPVALRGSIDADDEHVDTMVSPHPIPASVHPLAPVPEPLTPEPERAFYTEPGMTEVAPALIAAESADLPLASLVTSVEPLVPPEPIPPRSSFMASFLARRSVGLSQADPASRRDDPVMEPMPARDPGAPVLAEGTPAEDQFDWPEPAPTAPAGGGHGGTFEQVLEAHEAGDHEIRTADHATDGERSGAHDEVIGEPAGSYGEVGDDALAPGPVVVGRYNAGSASYVMYSNGMIEVETDTGTHRFASMQDLKAFIERRDSA